MKYWTSASIVALAAGCVQPAEHDDPDTIDSSEDAMAWASEEESDGDASVLKSHRCIPQSGSFPRRTVDFDPKVDGDKFIASLMNRLNTGTVKGYGVSLQNRFTNVATVTGGWAVDNCADDAQEFTVDTRIAWGSVSKTITTAAVLHAVENEGLVLDSEIQGDLPSRWRPELHAHFKKGGSTGVITHSTRNCGGAGQPACKGITWRDLLSHRAGMRKSSGGPWTPSSMRTRISSYYFGLTSKGTLCALDPEDKLCDPAVGTYNYSNTLGLAGFMLFDQNEPSQAWTLERSLKDASDATFDRKYTERAAQYYRDYVKANVFAPSSIPTAFCDAREARDANLPYARGYTSTSDTSGTFPSDSNLHCASGGWVMSLRHMMRFLRTLRHTDKILHDNTRRLMENTTSPDFALGFNEFVRIGDGTAFVKNGSIPNHTYAVVAMLPGGYQAAAVANSPIDTIDLEDIIRDAWNESQK